MSDVHFSNIKKVIIRHIKSATREIKIAVAWFTDTQIIAALETKSKQGVAVEVIIYGDSINKIDLFEMLHINGGVIYTYKQSRDIMHHKFCIIDNEIVLNGSYNWTANANTNQENIVVISDFAVVSKFLKEFNTLKVRARNVRNEFVFVSDRDLERLAKEYQEYKKSVRPSAYPYVIFVEYKEKFARRSWDSRDWYNKYGIIRNSNEEDFVLFEYFDKKMFQDNYKIKKIFIEYLEKKYAYAPKCPELLSKIEGISREKVIKKNEHGENEGLYIYNIEKISNVLSVKNGEVFNINNKGDIIGEVYKGYSRVYVGGLEIYYKHKEGGISILYSENNSVREVFYKELEYHRELDFYHGIILKRNDNGNIKYGFFSKYTNKLEIPVEYDSYNDAVGYIYFYKVPRYKKTSTGRFYKIENIYGKRNDIITKDLDNKKEYYEINYDTENHKVTKEEKIKGESGYQYYYCNYNKEFERMVEERKKKDHKDSRNCLIFFVIGLIIIVNIMLAQPIILLWISIIIIIIIAILMLFIKER